MKFQYSDGGRSNYFEANFVGDCVCRAIANATGKDYKEVYNALKRLEKEIKLGKHETRGTVRDGVRRSVAKHYIEKELGWKHHSTVIQGRGVTVHLTEEELPAGTLIVDISRHYTCVKDGTVVDTYDCSVKEYYDDFGNLVVNNRRAVYNYWTKD